ncbi:DUF2752 domain-containing protein (plasmid) [Paenibacillus cellulosilyticus]|uniref:DUF2752 domain-containing protein n=1 Tax=Paenibacillus cellulosilyticus TaxID=375489 RepID=UPI000D71889F|nr:DUF2752 domain-containing protein [Paenibacillus cellulosilyticus]QKS48192.1 DUF2752 domain-containing protein [Paenibacillus cellulosilyticus]
MLTKWRNVLAHPSQRRLLVRGSWIVGAGLTYLLVWLPLTGIGIPCVFHLATGLYCPGCGITRAVTSLLHLQLYQAFRYNPLVFTLVPIYILYWFAVRGQHFRMSKVTMGVMLAITIAFGILRNLPAWDFLAPTLLN